MTRLLIVSVSGGRTSAYMARLIQTHCEVVESFLGCELDIRYVFANTGMEHEDTLRFLNDVDQNFDLNITWLEGATYPGERKGSTPRVTSYPLAYRIEHWRDERHPFHANVRKHGVSNPSYSYCSGEMKRTVINKWAASLKEKVSDVHLVAIGIREDEKRRISKTEIDSKRHREFFYPLIDLFPCDKDEVLEWWKQFDWDLDIPEYLGNCVSCYKKGYKKLMAAYQDFPRAFDFNREMERRYGSIQTETEKTREQPPRVTFRKHMSTDALIKSFSAIDNDPRLFITEESSCSESCEPWEMEV